MASENVVYADEPLVELKEERINGEIYMMSSALYWHSNVTHNINMLLSVALGRGPCRATKEDVDFKYHPDCKDENLRDDYVCPDVMIMCDRKKIKGGVYYGVPKFVVEVISPSTAHKDYVTKMHIYEEAGVSEYWIITTNSQLNIYYLVDGHYTAQGAFLFCNDKDSKNYNADTKITLREFPRVTMTLGQIFEDQWEFQTDDW